MPSSSVVVQLGYFAFEVATGFTCTYKSYTDPDKAKPAADGGKLAQPDRQLCIVRANAGVAHRRAVRRNHLARPALAHLIGLADPTVAPCRQSWSIHGGIFVADIALSAGHNWDH